MKQITVGIIAGLAVCIATGVAFKKGYNKGVEDCKRMIAFADKVVESVTKEDK